MKANALSALCRNYNLKSAVLERCGQAIRFNPALLAFAGHYRFEPRPVAVARGNDQEPQVPQDSGKAAGLA